ncbi:MAG: hypothetical protein JO255_01700 [Alphaproteobacteria bacterium]|nr:hypothetical protein [Alphaproteobacteria bacterium]
MRPIAVALLAFSLLSGSAVVTAEAQYSTQQPKTTPRSTATQPSTGASTAPAAAGQFQTEAAAKQHCPTDNVVWVNTKSKVYHYAGTKDYGNTKQGAYMCQQDSDRGGFHAAKNEKPPAKSPG